jgi:hypothetical protein
MNTLPFMNNCLIQVIREDDGVSRLDDNESKNKGLLIDFAVSKYHITASAALKFDEEWREEWIVRLTTLKGSMVRWEEFAEGGQTFEEDGKTYALIPWWRIISYEREQDVI